MKFQPLMVAALAATSMAFVLASQLPASADRSGYYPGHHSSKYQDVFVIAANGAAVTASPASDDEVVAELEESTRVVVLDTASNGDYMYYYVEVLDSGTRGWINANLVQRVH